MSGAQTANALSRLEAGLPLLRCPRCAARLRVSRAPGEGQVLGCTSCGREIAVRDGIPRFVETPDDELARRTQASFGYEWAQFDDWTASGSTNFQDYFSGIDLAELRHARVLDAGCGMGRHARQLAAHCDQLVAVDFSRAVDVAARNVAEVPNVICVQADLTNLPLADGTFDFVYSLGVLHHLHDTLGVLRHLVQKTRPGGRIRIYVYWKRYGIAGFLLGGATALRIMTTRMPMRPLKVFAWALSVVLAGGIVLPYRLLARAGVRIGPRWPLSVYAKYPFEVLYNDQFDRFSAPLEKRYDADEVRRMMVAAGLIDVRVFDRYGWIAEGVRPAC